MNIEQIAPTAEDIFLEIRFPGIQAAIAAHLASDPAIIDLLSPTPDVRIAAGAPFWRTASFSKPSPAVEIAISSTDLSVDALKAIAVTICQSLVDKPLPLSDGKAFATLNIRTFRTRREPGAGSIAIIFAPKRRETTAVTD